MYLLLEAGHFKYQENKTSGQVTGAIEVFEELTRSTGLAGKADISGVTGEAWYYLGLSHQHAEREDDAIAAFRK